jgi:hypothetical protein
MKVILRYPEDRTLVMSDNRNPDGEGEADLKMEPMTVANGLSAVAFGLQRDSIKN